MLERLKQMLIKEFIQVFRDKRTRFLLFVPPLVQMFIFGYAASFEVRHVRTAVLDFDHSQESRDFLSRLSATPYFEIGSQVTTPDQIRDLIDRGKAVIAVRIDAGFARRLRKGQTAPVQIILDATNSNTALIALGYVNQVGRAFASDYQRDLMQRAAPELISVVPSVGVEQRPWYNTDLHSRMFFVPGVIGSLSMLIVINLTAFAIVREREIGTLEQIMVTPVRSFELILGKTIPFFLIGLADVALIGTLGTLWFGIPLRGSVFVLLTGTVLFLFCMLGVGLLISTVCSTQQQAMVTAFFFIMPAITFSGFAFPLSTMPRWLQLATYLSPLRYMVIVLRGVFLKGIGFTLLWPEMAEMAILGTSLLVVSVIRFRKTID
jgi:ABC-2 type transport system permease protein